MESLESYKHLYNPLDKSELNKQIKLLLELAEFDDNRSDLHRRFGDDIYTKDFWNRTLNEAEGIIEEASLSQQEKAKRRELVARLRGVDPPKHPPTKTDPSRPKY